MSAAKAITRLALLTIGAVSTTVADDFVWEGTCGIDDWMGTCAGEICSVEPLEYWQLNNWGRSTCGASPDFPGETDSVFIGSAAVRLGTWAEIANLSIDGGFLQLTSRQSLVFQSGPGGAHLSNCGTLLFDTQDWMKPQLVVHDGDLMLSGNGTITLHGGCIYGVPETTRIVNEGNTIHGTGSITIDCIASVRCGLINRGLIEARADESLSLSPSTEGIINSGVLRSAIGGTIHLSGLMANSEASVPGLLEADGGTIWLGGTVTGGILRILGAGEIRLESGSVTDTTIENSAKGTIRVSGANNNSSVSGFLNPAGGRVVVENSGRLSLLAGTYTNAGSVEVSGGYYQSYLYAWGGVITLTGGGTITLDNGSGNVLLGGVNGGCLVNEDNTIQGSGVIQNLSLTNRGLIEANVAGRSLSFYGGDIVNSGAVRASSGSSISLSGGTFTNLEGSTPGILETSDSTLTIGGATVTGGSLRVLGTGEIRLESGSVTDTTIENSAKGTIRVSGANNNSSVSGFLNPAGGRVVVENSGRLSLQAGTYTNAGSVEVSGGYYPSYLYAWGGVITLTGGGTITLDNGSGNVLLGGVNGGCLVNEDNTIQGSGVIQNLPLTNRGLVEAAHSGRVLALNPGSAGVVNGGVMRATNGGELLISSGSLLNFDGVLNGSIVCDGGSVRLSGTSVTGGTLTSATCEEIVGSSTVTLTDISLSSASRYRATGSSTSLNGTVINDGTMTATNGATLQVYDQVGGTGSWTADGGIIRFRGGATAATDGPISIANNGQVALESASLTGSDLTMDATGTLNVNGVVMLSGDLDFAMTAESKWSWAPGSALTMNEGTNAAVCNDLLWATLEVGSVDDGAGGSGANNFGLRTLAIGEQAAVTLVDYRDNGNRGGSGGADEALYMDMLTLSAGATLNLNGLHLYASGQQVLPGPYGNGMVIDFHFALLGDVDGDGTSSTEDFFAFAECMAGPEVTAPPPGVDPEWFESADMACDEDVDLADFGIMQAQFGG